MAQASNKASTGTGLKKRQLIESAGRSMFVWVAIASVAVSICVVTAQFLFQKWDYNNAVLGAKVKASDQLSKNITSARQLQTAVGGLVSNDSLASVKTNTDDPNTKSVLDALPSTFDPTAFATSLQQRILTPSGVSIQDISVPTNQAATSATPATGASGGNTNTTITGPVADPTPQPMQFDVTVGGSYDQIHSLMLDFERTIRPIQVTSLALTGSDATLTAQISGVTYYQLSKSSSVKQETVK